MINPSPIKIIKMVVELDLHKLIKECIENKSRYALASLYDQVSLGNLSISDFTKVKCVFVGMHIANRHLSIGIDI